MLPHGRRATRILFDKTLQKSTVAHAPYFSARVGLLEKEPSLSASPQASRFSFVVSKKVAHKATKRNLIRRRAYAGIEHLAENVKPGLVILFFAKKGIETLSQKVLEQTLKDYLSQHNLIQ